MPYVYKPAPYLKPALPSTSMLDLYGLGPGAINRADAAAPGLFLLIRSQFSLCDRDGVKVMVVTCGLLKLVGS